MQTPPTDRIEAGRTWIPAAVKGGLASHSHGLSLLALVLLLASWAWVFQQSRARELFGGIHDDAVLMSSAKALAEGKGYVLPFLSDPRGVSPVQTKYPILYPWLLSLVWKLNPNFPQNLDGALHLAMILGCVALLACYAFVGSLGAGRGLALGITAYCGFHFIFLANSTRILTDVPTMALTLFAAVAADRALEADARWWLMSAAAVLTALATLMRTVGVTIILVVVVLALLRRRFGGAAAFLAVCVPLVVLGILWPGNNRALQGWVAGGGPGFRQTWAYYTSYPEFWRMSVPDLSSLAAMVGTNLLLATDCPAFYFLLAAPVSLAAILLQFALSAWILIGVASHARQYGLRVIHFLLPVQFAILLVWTQQGDLAPRFLLPFLPLFCIGAWWQLRRLAGWVSRTVRSSRPLVEKIVAAAVVFGLIASAAQPATAYFRQSWSFVMGARRRDAQIRSEKAELYAWVKAYTSPAARIVSCDDAELYLYTGRHAMWPVAITPEMFYTGDRRLWERDRRCLLDTARYIGASYWVRAPDDFLWGTFQDLYLESVDRLLRPLPVVFESSGGRIRVYDVSSLVRPEARMAPSGRSSAAPAR